MVNYLSPYLCRVCRVLIASAGLVVATVSAQSKMPQVLPETNLPPDCKHILMDFAEELIGPKKHRILRNPTPHSPFFEAFMLLSYNDQETHVHFTAVPTEKGCEVSYSESFEIKTPCMDAREALFKRWQLIGKLSNTTMVMRYDFPRDKKNLPPDENDRATAYLTQTRNGAGCLVTKKQQHIQAIKKE